MEATERPFLQHNPKALGSRALHLPDHQKGESSRLSQVTKV